MNPEQLEDVILNKERRILQRVTIDDFDNTIKLLSSTEEKRDFLIKENILKFN